MFAALILAATPVWADELPSHLMVRISEAQSAYRNCIADSIADGPKGETIDAALATALGQCRDAEEALRAECKNSPFSNTAETLAIVLDTRMEGQEAGLQRREAR